jgi:hypothetical protein
MAFFLFLELSVHGGISAQNSKRIQGNKKIIIVFYLRVY